jgi:hypothetical protein
MTQAIAGDATRNDPSALREKIPQQPGVFEIDCCLVQAKPAGPAPLK